MSDQHHHCINCGIATWRRNPIGLHQIEDEGILSVIQQWVAPQVVNSSHRICQRCRDIVINSLGVDEQLSSSTAGHRQVCVNCGRSVLRARSHLLRTDTERERRIHTVICEWILPRTISRNRALICHSCWVRADRNAHHFVSAPSGSSTSAYEASEHEISTLQSTSQATLQSTSQATLQSTSQASLQSTSEATPRPTEAIVLPDYVRAVETESRCFIEGCRRQERNRVPDTTRKTLLDVYNFYIPKNNRLCNHHINTQSWDFITGALDNYVNVFTALHIQNMLELKGQSNAGLDFINILNMEDRLVHHWIGFTKEQYQRILDEVPQLLHKSSGPIGLTAYLMKLRTGDSNERISALFNMPKRTLDGYVSEARHLMYEYFVPRHLGLNHINRQQIVDRNLLIPNGLFGNHNGENKPVIIIDGTYCYIEKSSNYLYQKRTYSLHKYNNLVKPLMIVCADGHIVDVMGPYPATTSDADIINHEFRDPSSMLREYFQAGDAFILDRGFRDALPLLHECGYRTYIPPTLQAGEWQHSTLEANKSRAVTICRWVVEVVNGRFKRDFKLFRQEYFNTASKHLMIDFEVAAALLNTFHPPITNRVDAGDILQIINENMNKENDLGYYVIQNNINRRRADFTRIHVENDNLNDFPQLAHSDLVKISLGIYQIKQARSYYGEHIRQDGRYEIEVCRETDSNLLRELSISNNSSWLLRGRIKSRHVSSKTYFTYILVDSSLNGREAIKQYYCNCLVGKRTVGCCCHVMSIIWYLSWARHQDNLMPPAQFLDDILIVYDEVDDE